jgi:hypothetical protein
MSRGFQKLSAGRARFTGAAGLVVVRIEFGMSTVKR